MRRPGRAVGGRDGGRAALQYVPVFYYSYKRPKGAEAMSFYFLVTVSKHHHCRSFSMLAFPLALAWGWAAGIWPKIKLLEKMSDSESSVFVLFHLHFIIILSFLHH